MTEFSVSIREMQENYKVYIYTYIFTPFGGEHHMLASVLLFVHKVKCHLQLMDFQQRKCNVIFDLSCNLARVLEFCTREIPQAFISGMDTNLRRLAELIVFILTHLIGAIDPEVFDL